ncbi:MAG: hypothetical protein KA287_07675, partial [Rhodoferax sp.]|nr:hypothetical protein [Rhodoferax sp.]
ERLVSSASFMGLSVRVVEMTRFGPNLTAVNGFFPDSPEDAGCTECQYDRIVPVLFVNTTYKWR